jgi:endoglucanase
MKFYASAFRTIIRFILYTFIYFSLVICQTIIGQVNIDTSFVIKNGLLRVSGNQIVNKDGQPAIIKGMSLFWSQYMDKYYNYDCIKWLHDDWNCSVIRIAMATGQDGYQGHPEEQMKIVRKVVDGCIVLGIYVIVDWHSHNAQDEVNMAVPFFQEIARQYGDKPNIIYEIYNEPLRVSWSDVVKPYCDSVIKAIRKIDPDNLIIVGSPHWSQDVDVAANDPLKDTNVAYSVHFYAGTHKQWLRNKVDSALSKGIAIFVTEFGTCLSNGNGDIDYEETNIWFDYLKKNNLSWCNWAVADKDETASILRKDANTKGKWGPADITESGNIIRKELKK